MTMRFQESRMSGDLLVRFDEGEWVARKCRPLSYSTYLKARFGDNGKVLVEGAHGDRDDRDDYPKEQT